MYARIVLHGDLPDLAPRRGQGENLYPADRRASIKDVVEAFGPPHTEVGRILQDGQERDFSARLAAGSCYEIFPVDTPWDVTAPSVLRPEPLFDLKFLVDENTQRLAGLLRMVGMDAAGCRGLGDEAIARAADEQGRVLLSRDRRLLRRKAVVFGRLVRCVHPWDQLREIVHLFGLRGRLRPFSRCIHCKVPLKARAKEVIEDQLEPLTKKYYRVFQGCPACGRIYWAGSHHQSMLERLKSFGIGD